MPSSTRPSAAAVDQAWTVRPSLLTNANDDDGMLAQAALQHVVMTYDPTHGRVTCSYVNGHVSPA